MTILFGDTLQVRRTGLMKPAFNKYSLYHFSFFSSFYFFLCFLPVLFHPPFDIRHLYFLNFFYFSALPFFLYFPFSVLFWCLFHLSTFLFLLSKCFSLFLSHQSSIFPILEPQLFFLFLSPLISSLFLHPFSTLLYSWYFSVIPYLRFKEEEKIITHTIP